MYILDFWEEAGDFFSDPLGYVFDSIGDIISDGIRTLIYTLSTEIYKLIIWLYDIFLKLCNSRLLDSTVLKIITEKVGLILGIVMLFMVTFSAIQMLLEPEKLTDKEKGIGNIVKKVILVIVMLGISKSAFTALYKIQTIVINSNIISKFLLPYETDTDNFGGTLSSAIFTSFYQIKEPENASSAINICNLFYDELKKNIKTSGDFSAGRYCLNNKYETNVNGYITNEYLMDFSLILLPIAGIAVVYFLFSYCISVGIRTVQLAFLEIISPMAIVSYLSPKKDTMFEKWWKMYFSTYIDVFIRIIIINLSVFLIATIIGGRNSWTFWDTIGETSKEVENFIWIVMAIAILMFAKKVPELIKKLFPASDGSGIGFGIKSPKKMFGDMLGGDLIQKGLNTATGLAIGAATGGVGNMVRGAVGAKPGFINRLKGAFGGLGGGALTGAKAGAGAKGIGKALGASNKAAVGQNRRIAEWRANGGTSAWSRWATGFQQRFGLQTEAEKLDLNKANLEEENSIYKAYDSYVDAAEKRAESQIHKGKFNSNDNARKALEQKNLAEIYRQQSATIKRSDFEDGNKFKAKVCSKFGIKRDNYADDESYNTAIQNAIKNNKYTYDVFVEEEYQLALSDLATKASEADSKYLNLMKAAKSDYITESARNENFDSVVTQNLQQASGIIEANIEKVKFTYKDDNGQIHTAQGNELLDYDIIDKINVQAKEKISKNNTELARDKVTGASARADAKYSKDK